MASTEHAISRPADREGVQADQDDQDDRAVNTRPTAIPITIVICTKDRSHCIRRAVESVVSQTYRSYDVLIIDQSRTDDTRRELVEIMERHANVRYIHMRTVGKSLAYNLAIQHATGDILACTDDDCTVSENWLTAIAHSFAEHPDVALMFGQVQLPAELAEQGISGGTIPTLYFQERRRLNREEGFQIFGMGANFAVRRSMCEHIHGFDVVLGAGGILKSSEDFDFMYRVFRAGGTILTEPDLVVYHYGFRSQGDWPATLRGYGFGDGAFYLKHVRAGDLYAARLLIYTFSLHFARELKHFIQRGPKGSQWSYVRTIPVGAMHSLRFTVDRKRRLYTPPALHKSGV